MDVETLHGGVTLYPGDCLRALPQMPDNSIDACVTDPPYGLEFMGKEWDTFKRPSGAFETRDKSNDPSGKTSSPYLAATVSYHAGPPFQQWTQQWAAEVFRVLKPGAHMLVCGGTRTYHRMVCAIEDAGFEIRDCVLWLYGSGFPKNLDVAKGIDKHKGAKRKATGRQPKPGDQLRRMSKPKVDGHWQGDQDFRAVAKADVANRARERKGQGRQVYGKYADQQDNWTGIVYEGPVTVDADEHDGFGTALKPACELVVLARKPLSEKTVAANVLRWGTGALNIAACRVPTTDGYADNTVTQGLSRDPTSYQPRTEPRVFQPGRMRTADPAPSVQRSSQQGLVRTAPRKLAVPYADPDNRLGMGRDMMPMTSAEEFHQIQHESIARMARFGRWPANVIHDGSPEVVAGFPDTGAISQDDARNNPAGSMVYTCLWHEAFRICRNGDNLGGALSVQQRAALERHFSNASVYARAGRAPLNSTNDCLTCCHCGGEFARLDAAGVLALAQRLCDAHTLRVLGACPMRERILSGLSMPSDNSAPNIEGVQGLTPEVDMFVLARKPLSKKSVAANVLRWGTGALNIDATRVGIEGGTEKADPAKRGTVNAYGDGLNGGGVRKLDAGRWPANVIHDGSPQVMSGFPDTAPGSARPRNNTAHADADALFPGVGRDGHVSYGYEDAGGSAGRFFKTIAREKGKGRQVLRRASLHRHDGVSNAPRGPVSGYMQPDSGPGHAARYFKEIRNPDTATSFAAQPGVQHGDSGSVSRFFYVAKADITERAASSHPTVKPIDLMRYLIRLVTPPGGTVLDPFAGTGTTGEAAILEGARAILVEREAAYQQDIRNRMATVQHPFQRRIMIANKHAARRPPPAFLAPAVPTPKRHKYAQGRHKSKYYVGDDNE
jgi:DNA modification methylase